MQSVNSYSSPINPTFSAIITDEGTGKGPRSKVSLTNTELSTYEKIKKVWGIDEYGDTQINPNPDSKVDVFAFAKYLPKKLKEQFESFGIRVFWGSSDN